MNCFKYLLFFLLPLQLLAKDFNVMDFGARADGRTKDTKAVQAAVDACTENGGGLVLIPAGKTVVIGTIFMKDFVTLHIEGGAVLMGSPDIKDYAENTFRNQYKNEPHMDKCLIFAQDAKSFAIEGYGAIDGNGHPENFNNKTGRPMMIRFLNCQNIHIRDVTLINPAAWTSAWIYCDNIVVDGISIRSRVNHNGDGLDFDGCTNVRVSNSSFDTSDDSICLQASDPEKPCKNVTVTNCTFTSKWAGMRIGLLSRGDFESVTVSNCTFNDIQDAGLKIQMNEGGEMKNMTFTNLTMKNVPRPVFMTFAQQRAFVGSPEGVYPSMKSMHNFIFSNIIADNSELDKDAAFYITGMPGHDIENILFSNIQFIVPGGGTAEDAAKTDIKEYTLDVLEGWWPEFHLTGTLPAYGFYVRHVKGLTLDNIHIYRKGEDARKPVFLEDVKDHHIKSVYVNNQSIAEKDIVQSNKK
ncbi:glycoside hydrolase family 28 protein [Fulvivirga sp. M361]|uniref:glycoside hydrolase family 28 protein n=1 Tax=Fulvivirga sp. M361 TaxID=2594266 RepID=UPI00117BDB11|nr:glycosyl hydrolase family 28 protein [Fulvivirga sp. M361]TRX51588.1 glycoside hydrolase family 28 protein [Fulvivirga sp. M361]